MNEWDVKLLERVVFNEKLSERPWVLHTKIEPKISCHMIDPLRVNGQKGDDYICVCSDTIPPSVMQKFFFLKGICEGKRPGQQ